MSKTVIIKSIAFLILSALLFSCTEPYALQTNTFEDVVVIEATLTNELKKQEIKISRTYHFEENGPTFERGANVIITDDQGNTYDFIEQSESYVSASEFQAEPGRQYKLSITTANGKTYTSTNQTLTTVNQMESVVPAVVVKEGDRGVQINVSSFDPTNTSKYYRYTYEETYKVIAPKWVSHDLYYDGSTSSFELALRDVNTKTCYSTVNSNTIILTSTNELSEDRVIDFPVRFISNKDYIISHRYSILVKQYIQNLEAYTFYRTLKELSSSESLLSQNQPGFFYGNIKSVSNPQEKVIGFFDVSSVSSKRIFFNYTDLFPGEPLPPYFNECTDITFDISLAGPPSGTDRLKKAIETNSVRYFNQQNPEYNMVPPVCGDCTSFSSNLIPSFWIN